MSKQVEVAGVLEKATTTEKAIVKISKLTKSQEALLEVLGDPRVIPLDVTQICKLANVTRATYYSAFKDSDFLAALEQMTQELMLRSETAIIHNVLEKAKDPKEKNQHWAHMVLKMRGRLEEKSNRPAQVIVNFNVKRPDIVIDRVIDVTAEVVESN